MKLLLLLSILLSGCGISNTIKNSNIEYLNTKIAEEKRFAVLECNEFALSIKQIAIYRDTGVHKEQMLDIIFVTLKKENDATITALTTEKVASFLITVDLIYNEPHIHVQRVYKIFYDECIKINYQEIAEMREYLIERIKKIENDKAL